MDFNPAKSHQARATSGEALAVLPAFYLVEKVAFWWLYSIITHASVLEMGQELLEVSPRLWLRLVDWRLFATEASGKESREPTNVVVGNTYPH